MQFSFAEFLTDDRKSVSFPYRCFCILNVLKWYPGGKIRNKQFSSEIFANEMNKCEREKLIFIKYASGLTVANITQSNPKCKEHNSFHIF